MMWGGRGGEEWKGLAAENNISEQREGMVGDICLISLSTRHTSAVWEGR